MRSVLASSVCVVAPISARGGGGMEGAGSSALTYERTERERWARNVDVVQHRPGTGICVGDFSRVVGR